LATVLAEDPTADASSFATHPMRNVLTNALGSREDVDVHIQEHDIGPGDSVVLTTDGVHGAIDAAGLLAVLARSADPETAASELVAAALAAGSRDNATAVVATCHTETSV
jgi:protein phosphatase